MQPDELITLRFSEAAALKQQALAVLKKPLADAAELIVAALKRGGKVLTAGNGGSAADAQHLVAELVGRFMRERPGVPAVALSANASTLTALVNDYPPEMLFGRQLEALGRPGDVLVAFSTSGKSPNIVRALRCARQASISTIGLTGEGGLPAAPSDAAQAGGAMAGMCDVLIAVPSRSTPRIQEVHVLALHVICELVETAMFACLPRRARRRRGE